MLSDLDSPSYTSSSSSSSPSDYFSIVPSPSTHFSVETPSASPLSSYSSEVYPSPTNPLLAFREPPSHFHTAFAMDASKVLQLQTAAAHSQPTAASSPMQHSSSTSSNSSTSSTGSNSPSPPILCCARCRRSSAGYNGMVRFGTNLYYCSHCASMVGYSSPG